VFTLDPATWTLAYRVHVRYELESASADGKRLAVNDPQDSVCDDAYLYDGVAGEYQAAFEAGSNYVAYQVLSAGGKWLATVGDATRLNGRLRLWDAATEKAVPLADAPDDKFRYGKPVFTPDGKMLLVSVGRSNPKDAGPPLTAVARWDTATGKRLPDLPGTAGGVHALAVSPDGKLLVSTGADGVIHRFDASGEPIDAED
jgi:WD40 repeat protein